MKLSETRTLPGTFVRTPSLLGLGMNASQIVRLGPICQCPLIGRNPKAAQQRLALLVHEVMVRKKPVSIEIVHEEDTSFIVSTYADGEIVREPIVRKKARRKPFRPQRRLTMDRTRKKQF
jgi:hypothetical protein